MNDLIKPAADLAALLDRESIALQTLANRLRADRRALISGDGHLLASATDSWAELSRKRTNNDRERLILIERISSIVGIPAAKLCVTKITKLLPPSAAHPLRRAGERVRTAAQEAALEVAVGQDLLEEAARFHEGLLRNISTAIAAPSPAYGQKDSQKTAALSMVDTIG